MKGIKGNIMDWYGKPNTVCCIPTCGSVTTTGKLVMGAGVARLFRDKVTGLDEAWGSLVVLYGSMCWFADNGRVMSFPTKGDWKDKAELRIIKESASELASAARSLREATFILPRVGCGKNTGQLDWKDVKPVLEQHLGDLDNVWIVSQE